MPILITSTDGEIVGLMGRRRSLPAHAEWRRVLRAVRAARDAAFLGPHSAAKAAVAELLGAPSPARIATAAVLSSQRAKGAFGTDLETFWAELKADDAFRREMSTPGPRTGRRRPNRQEPRDPLPVEAARAVPIGALLERQGFRLRRVGREWVTRCPFHDDCRPSLHVSPAKGLWHCFACGVGGDGIAFLMRLRKIGFVDAVRDVAS